MKRAPGDDGAGGGVGQAQPARLPQEGSDMSALPEKPTVTRDDMPEEEFRAAWCKYKYDCNRRGVRFTHEDLGKALGLTGGSARNYYNDVWKPKRAPD